MVLVREEGLGAASLTRLRFITYYIPFCYTINRFMMRLYQELQRVCARVRVQGRGAVHAQLAPGGFRAEKCKSYMQR